MGAGIGKARRAQQTARFAPSPTGTLHIGNARTALFNWLLARHSGGKMVLRIEDTDLERSTPEHTETILDAMRWLGLDWDEGPIFQGEHRERHEEVLQALLAAGLAYHSTARREDVDAWKQEHGSDKGFRGQPEPEGAIRLSVPPGTTIVHDLVHGEAVFENERLDDFVIARADGTPLYNLAATIDDMDSGISHVVRGDDHLSNTPRQLIILEACRSAGIWNGEAPIYAHLPLLHGPNGKPLSKRDGAASVQDLRDAGYLPEAVRNYLALLGWGPGENKTIMDTDEMVKLFSLERVSANPAQLDEDKLRWMNGIYIRELPAEELAKRLEEFTGRENLEEAARISQEKIATLADFLPLTGALLDGPEDEPKAIKKWLNDDGLAVLQEARDGLSALPNFDTAGIEAALESVVTKRDISKGRVYQPLRVALTGKTVSPGIFESIALLGRNETLKRIDARLG